MTRRRRWVLGGLALLLAGLAGWALWPRAAPPPRPRAVAEQKPRKHPRVRAMVPPEAPLAEETPDAARPLAIPAPVEDTSPPVPVSQVVIRALYPNGEPVLDLISVESRDCMTWTRPRPGPDVRVTFWGEDQCTLKVGRPDGRLYAWSELQTVPLTPGEETQLTVTLPAEPTGGLGIAFRAAEEGMVVERVWPGSPAEQMGLEEGDVIVEVDGLPTDTLTEDEFISVMTGPVGTEVDFVIGYDADTGWLEEPLALTRALIN